MSARPPWLDEKAELQALLHVALDRFERQLVGG